MSRMLTIAAILLAVPAAAAPPAKVYVVLWFDTEDYLLPASDDAALRVADWLTREGVRATFKIVGEKARVLEQRGRKDVIEALKKHEIGYHSQWHSVQPTPAMYLSNLGWDEGVAEFDRREGSGLEDVKRIFSQFPSCYGQPGSSWGPQSFGAMKKWGVNVYLDAGRHVSLEGEPHYYCGQLTLYHLTHTQRTNLGGEKDLKTAEDRFIESRQKLLDAGGGIVSIYYHPCEFVHEQFWDAVNFSKGANPPRDKWQVPPRKTDEASKIAFETFESYIRFIKRFPGVQFVTASELATIYRDRAIGREFTAEDFRNIAEKVKDELTFQRYGDFNLAPSEALVLLAGAFRALAEGSERTTKLMGSPLGPTGRAPAMTELVTTDASQFIRTTADVHDFIQRHGRVPSAVWLGSTAVTPEAYLVSLARMYELLESGRPLPESIELKPIRLEAEKYVADDDPRLWGWVIFPPGFRAPHMMELARRQAWTIKPAINHGPPAEEK